MRVLGALLALALVTAAAAQEPKWVLVAASPRTVTGERFDLILIAPPAEALPEEISVVVRSGQADVRVAMQAAAPEENGRRRYFARLPEGLSGAATVSLAAQSSNSLAIIVTRRDAMDALVLGDEPPLSQNDPIYFIVGTRDGASARFQLSFKYRLFDTGSGFGREQPWLSRLYIAYTQNSLWDLESSSKPFEDTSYRPSLFWTWERADQKTWIDAARLGLEHESNGREGVDSRSLNTAFVRPEWRWQLGEGNLEFTPRINAYLEKDENPDIAEYRGYVDWRARFDSGELWVASTVVRYGTAGKGSILIDLSRRTRDFRLGPVSGYLHAQFFAGYGEDILTYNIRKKSQLRLGFAIVP